MDLKDNYKIVTLDYLKAKWKDMLFSVYPPKEYKCDIWFDSEEIKYFQKLENKFWYSNKNKL